MSATDAFNRYLVARNDDLRRIASWSRGEVNYQNLESESWIVAIEIGVRRGWQFNFADHDDQDTLLVWLQRRFGRAAPSALRFAVSLDCDTDELSERTGAALARALTAPLDSDPQVHQMLLDERAEFSRALRASYTEAAAYVILLNRVGWILHDLASLLLIVVETLRGRLRRAGLLARVQASLFDGINEIDPNFVPARARPKPFRSFLESAATEQLTLQV